MADITVCTAFFVKLIVDISLESPIRSNALLKHYVKFSMLTRNFFINPEAIAAVCKEQGMDEGQCKLFSNGFQLIDRFITTIESKSSTKNEDPPKAETTKIPDRVGNDIMMDDAEYIMDIPQPHQKLYGSKTWSSQPEQNGPQLFEIRNDLVASFTPLPPAPPFVPPTPPAAPPLAFPTVSSLIPPFVAKILPVDKLLSLKADPIIRRQRNTDWDFIDDDSQRRVRRGDYYDEIQSSKSEEPRSSSFTGSSSGISDDYYGSITDVSPTKQENNSPLQNCVHILGIY
ncbi:unnamed protein product [Strongylus vulgaris]|uniref:Uncharacterized protein n=1 Tax=Strongylus vulgaris TaxID=40348 RepID=A0A3P7JGH7_STRVU|nr:unnamed protein product [Strongylus vulgaris]